MDTILPSLVHSTRRGRSIALRYLHQGRARYRRMDYEDTSMYLPHMARILLKDIARRRHCSHTVCHLSSASRREVTTTSQFSQLPLLCASHRRRLYTLLRLHCAPCEAQPKSRGWNKWALADILPHGRRDRQSAPNRMAYCDSSSRSSLRIIVPRSLFGSCIQEDFPSPSRHEPT